MTNEEIHKSFILTTEWVSKNTMPATNDEKLICYGYYKQATEGDNTSEKPWEKQLEKKAKWEAWEAHKCMSSNEAKNLYISKIIEYRKKYKL